MRSNAAGPVLALVAGLSASACDAAFEDLGSDDFLGAQGRPDLGPGPDLGPLPLEEVLLATGVWTPEDYDIAGSVELFRRQDGRLELVMSDDFRAFPVPGPVVVLTDRPEIGSRVDPSQGDFHLGPLRANSGPQAYEFPPQAVGSQFAFVYCEPFGLPVGRAELMPAP